jgi:hypothetical protein
MLRQLQLQRQRRGQSHGASFGLDWKDFLRSLTTLAATPEAMAASLTPSVAVAAGQKAQCRPVACPVQQARWAAEEAAAAGLQGRRSARTAARAEARLRYRETEEEAIVRNSARFSRRPPTLATLRGLDHPSHPETCHPCDSISSAAAGLSLRLRWPIPPLLDWRFSLLLGQN